MKELPKDINKPETQARTGPSVLIITGDKVEDLEFFYPYYRFIEAGCAVDVATPKGGAFEGKNGHDLKESFPVLEINAEEYDLLYLPGGKAPATLRKDENVLSAVRNYAATGKPIAAICHGPQILAAAGVIKGCRISAWPEVEEEVEKVGATYVRAETLVDGQFITGRWPGDLPALTKAALEIIGVIKTRRATKAA